MVSRQFIKYHWLLILGVLFFASSCTTGSKQLTIGIDDLDPVDTITLPFKSSHWWNQYYHPVFKKTILTFIEENPMQIVSVDPEVLESITFPLEKIESEYHNLGHPISFYIEDSSFAIVNFQNDRFKFFKIDRNGNICRTIPVKDQRSVKSYELYLYNSLLPIKKADNGRVTLCLNFSPDFERINYYISDRKVRNKKFAAKTNLLLEYTDSLICVYDEIGSFPKKLQNIDGYYYLEPEYCLGPSGTIINLFPSINYLSVTSQTDSTTFFKFNSDKLSDASPMTTNDLFDYNYLAKYTYENCFFGSVTYDKEYSNYYVISSIVGKYENDDGTVNDPVQKPWILMQLNEKFNVIHSITFPKDTYSKHNFFYCSRFLFLMDYDLTKKNGIFTFLKYKKLDD